MDLQEDPLNLYWFLKVDDSDNQAVKLRSRHRLPSHHVCSPRCVCMRFVFVCVCVWVCVFLNARVALFFLFVCKCVCVCVCVCQHMCVCLLGAVMDNVFGWAAERKRSIVFAHTSTHTYTHTHTQAGRKNDSHFWGQHSMTTAKWGENDGW